MSYVVALPEVLASSAERLVILGSSLAEANLAAAGGTTQLLAAAEDDVSAAIAALFSAHGQSYQELSSHVSAFHSRFVQTLASGAQAYSAAEAMNVAAAGSPMQQLLTRSIPRSRHSPVAL